MQLLAQYIYLRRSYKKLTERFIGLFIMEKIIESNIYKLTLSELYKRLYTIFHIFLLEFYK
jgi:hypothetical protein